MDIEDNVWGSYHIDEPFLVELIESAPVKRIKNIAQSGLVDGDYPRKTFSRYEHSVGVMLCLRYIGASVEEQAAGLLHDVSHTAFSHTVDRVLGDIQKCDYQDNRHEEVIMKSELPKIYAKYGFSIEDAINMDKFKLLERESPDLCADRIDYTLRQWAYDSPINEIKRVIEGLTVRDGEILFSNEQSARIFAQEYSALQENCWGSAEEMLREEILADALKYGLESGSISIADFDGNDNYIIEKLQASRIKHIHAQIELAKRATLNYKIVDTGTPNSIALHSKFRHVNPKYIDGKSVRRICDDDLEYVEKLKEQKIKSTNGVYVLLS